MVRENALQKVLTGYEAWEQSFPGLYPFLDHGGVFPLLIGEVPLCILGSVTMCHLHCETLSWFYYRSTFQLVGLFAFTMNRFVIL